MSATSRIRDALFGLYKSWGFNDSAFSAEVQSVDPAARSCSVLSISGEVETLYPNVWLMPEIQDGLFYVPKVGSTVIVQNNKNLQPYVVMWSAVDEIKLVTGGSVMDMTGSLIQFNRGANEGLVNVKPAVSAWNNSENKINDLIQAISGWTPVPNDGGAALKAALSSWVASKVPVTAQSDVEDTAVKH